MKKLIFILASFVLFFGACNIKPSAPSQEWCEWAFNQIPDHKDISEIDSTAFSTEFYGLLKEAYKAMDWETEMYPGMIGDYEFLFYWYDGNGDSILEPEDSELKYETGEVADGKTTVKVKVYAPSFAPYSPTDYEFDMDLVYEDGLWRIDDWSTPTRDLTMKDQVKRYIDWYNSNKDTAKAAE